jgi:peptidoglycan hydrolase-like protein with peptidoglycan-binding domain
MPQTIAAPVGRFGGTNRPSDVKVVQELLNRVPSAAGGPTPLLTVDSLCGPRTVEAIQKFQVKQLGWTLADGRVDPGGPTLQKLNELGGTGGTGTAKVLTASSILRCPHGAVVCPSIQGRPGPTSGGSPALRSTDRF